MSNAVSVDFDRVLHSYTSGYLGADQIPDPPVPGALKWLRTLLRRHPQLQTYIFFSEKSSGWRNGGHAGMVTILVVEGV